MSYPSMGNARPVDPLVLTEMGTLVDGEINRDVDYAGGRLFSPQNLGEGDFIDGRGGSFTIQRIAAGQLMKRTTGTRRAPGADIRMGNGLKLDPLTGRTVEHSVGEPLGSMKKKRAQGINLQAALTGWNIEKLRIGREFRLDDFLLEDWHPDSGNVATPWSDDANSDPIEDIHGAVDATRGNVIFFCKPAWNAFITHAKVLTARPNTIDRNILSEREALAEILFPKMGIERIVVSNAKYNKADGTTPYICGETAPYVWIGRDSTTWQDLGNRQFRVGYCAAKEVREMLPAGPGHVDPTYYNEYLLEMDYRSEKRSYDITAGHAELLMKINATAGMRLGGITT